MRERKEKQVEKKLKKACAQINPLHKRRKDWEKFVKEEIKLCFCI